MRFMPSYAWVKGGKAGTSALADARLGTTRLKAWGVVWVAAGAAESQRAANCRRSWRSCGRGWPASLPPPPPPTPKTARGLPSPRLTMPRTVRPHRARASTCALGVHACASACEWGCKSGVGCERVRARPHYPRVRWFVCIRSEEEMATEARPRQGTC